MFFSYDESDNFQLGGLERAVVWLGFFLLFLLTLFVLHRNELFPHFSATTVVDFTNFLNKEVAHFM